MMKNNPINLNQTEIIIAIQSLYVKRVSSSIEICAELVQDFMLHGVCRRGYRTLCSMEKTTVFDELLKLVPYQDRKMYLNNKTLFGIDNLDINVCVLRIYKNRKINAIIDVTNNRVLYDADNIDDETILFNQLMSVIDSNMYKCISSVLNVLSSEDNKKFFKENTWNIYDGMCSALVPENKIYNHNVGESHYLRFPEVAVHVNINLLGSIFDNMISSDNKEPVLLATNTQHDELFIVKTIDDDEPVCEMYIVTGNGEQTKSVIISSNIDIYIVFNSMISVLNASVIYNAKIDVK